MASLKETKGRIESVQSTLKITSAMKMVASAKLHKAQSAIENMLPYERKLQEMLRLLLASLAAAGVSFEHCEADVFGNKLPRATVAVVTFSSNSSLCGGFNSNVIRETRRRVEQLNAEGENVEIIAVGKKISEAMKKAGYPSAKDWSDLVAHASYQTAADLAQSLVSAYNSGKYSRIELIYNHFVSTSSQKVLLETYLPMDMASTVQPGPSSAVPEDIILEPSPEEMLEGLRPQVLALRIYTVVLDSVASEHAARTVAMQTATENGEDILQELTLEYNKGRQQKITNEILDIVGGSLQ